MHDLSEARWRTSSRSQASGNCVEVAFVGARAVVRDSKNLGGPAVVVARPCQGRHAHPRGGAGRAAAGRRVTTAR
jgi:hypothetical protein